MQPAFSAYPRCESGCTANDIVWVKAKMVESTLQPGYYDVLLDVQFNANAPRYRTLAVFDIAKSTSPTIPIPKWDEIYKCLNCPQQDSTGLAKDLLLTSFLPEPGVRYVVNDMYFAWDVNFDVTGCPCREGDCSGYQKPKCKDDFGFIPIRPAPVLETKPLEMCAGETKKLDLTVSGDSGSMGYKYEWTPSTYLDNPAIEDPMFGPAPVGTYQLNVKVTSIECAIQLDSYRYGNSKRLLANNRVSFR